MSYTPKQGNSSGSGGGNVNPNQMNQQAKATLADIANMQQQMQNLVSQSPQNPSLNAFFNLQQQSLLKQQMLLQNTQFLQQLQQQQQQQTQPPIQQNLAGKEPLALTRTPNAAELLNKTFQQQANGSAVGANLGNVAQFSQHLQAFPNTANLMQHLQAYQYQMQQQQQQQNQPQHQPHQQQNKSSQQPYSGQQNSSGHHNQQQFQQNYQQPQKFGSGGPNSQQLLPSAQHQQAHPQQSTLNKNSQNTGNQITKPPNLPAATQITPILPLSGSTSQQQQTNNNSQNKNHTKPQITMTPTTVGKTSSQHSTNKPTGGPSSFIGNRPVSSPYGKTSHGHYQNSSTLNYKTGSSKLPPPTQITAVPLMKPTIATSSPIKTSMPTGSNASSPRSGHTPPAVPPPKSITPPVSIISPGITPLPAKNTNVAHSKSLVHPIPTSIPAPIPAAVIAASATTTLTVQNSNQASVNLVTPAIATSTPQVIPKVSSTKLVDVTSKTDSKSSNLTELSSGSTEKVDSKSIRKKEETVEAKSKNITDESKTQNDCKKEDEREAIFIENKPKTNEALSETKNTEENIRDTETVVLKEPSTKKEEVIKINDKKEIENVVESKPFNIDKIEVAEKETNIPTKPEIIKDNKIEVKLVDTPESSKKQNEVLQIDEKKQPAQQNVQLNSEKDEKASIETKTEITIKTSVPKNIEVNVETSPQPSDNKKVDDLNKKIVEKSDKNSNEKMSEAKIVDKKVDEKILDKPEQKTVKKETISTSSKLSIYANEKEDDKKATGSLINSSTTKFEEVLDKVEKPIENAKEESSEAKSHKPEKSGLGNRNQQIQQQKTKNSMENIAKVEKLKTEPKKKNILTSVKEAPGRAKSTKNFAYNSDKNRNVLEEQSAQKKSDISTSPSVIKTKESSALGPLKSENNRSSIVATSSKENSITSAKTDPVTPKDDSGGSRSKRHRLKTILYQSPLPELAFITKLSASEASNSPKPGSANEDKLVLFYKNEYLAVRNSEGGFFLCQTLHNVYKTSPRIRIRWLSEEKSDTSVYIPDFYDNTDIECVLTTVDLGKLSRDRFKLPDHEKDRIENILKKAIDVEKGILPRPDITEENPDGLDISLYTDESQIEKKKRNSKSPRNSQSKKMITSNKKKSKSPSKTKSNVRRKREENDTENSDDEDEESNDEEYKPSHKKRVITQGQSDQSIRRLQRSPLAKARAASPITLKKQASKSVPQKSVEATPSSSRQSRAAKRRGTDSGTDDGTPNKRMMMTMTPSKKVNNKPAKEEDNNEQKSITENEQNVKNTAIKKTKIQSISSTSITTITSTTTAQQATSVAGTTSSPLPQANSNSPVSEKAPNSTSSTSSTPTITGSIRTTRSRK